MTSVRELLEHNKKYDKSAKRKAFNALSKRNYNFLRIEFNMFDKQSFINKGLSHIKTIGDILENYLELYSFWTKEISRIVLLNKLVLSKEMTPTQYIIARVLEIDGFASFERNCLKRAKPKNSSRIINEAIKVILDYSNLTKYNTSKFKLDIMKNLKRIKGKESDLNLELLSKNLFPSGRGCVVMHDAPSFFVSHKNRFMYFKLRYFGDFSDLCVPNI